MVDLSEILLRCSYCGNKKKFPLTKYQKRLLAEGNSIEYYCTFCQGRQNWLPVQMADLTETSTPASTEGKRILVVDDDDLTVILLRKVLETWNVQVEVAENGQEALAKLPSGNYDLMICDIRMPGMTGLELFQQIQENSYLPPERILFLTGDTSPAIKEFLNSSGCYYLYKPLQFLDFCEQVQALLAGEPLP